MAFQSYHSYSNLSNKSLTGGFSSIFGRSESAPSLETTPTETSQTGASASVIDSLEDAAYSFYSNVESKLLPLHSLAARGLSWPLRSQILLGAAVNAKNTQGQTPLHLAAANGYVSAVNDLLNGGAEINIQDNNLRTPLHEASMHGHDAVVSCLLENGAQWELEDAEGNTAMQLAVVRGMAEALDVLVLHTLKTTAAESNMQGETPLERMQPLIETAIETKQPASLRTLIRRGVLTPDMKRENGMSLLRLAARIGVTDTVSHLLNAGVMDMHTPNGKGVGKGEENEDYTLESLSFVDGENGDGPLHEAAAGGHLDIARLLLGYGLSVNSRNIEGETPLHHAASAGRQEIIRLLILGHGANIDAVTTLGRTPLHYAAAQGRGATVRLLCAHGACVDIPDEAGRIPLHYAATCCKRKAVEAILAAAGAPVDCLLARDSAGKTPYDLARAVNRPDAKDLLLPAGHPDRDLPNSEPITTTTAPVAGLAVSNKTDPIISPEPERKQNIVKLERADSHEQDVLQMDVIVIHSEAEGPEPMSVGLAGVGGEEKGKGKGKGDDLFSKVVVPVEVIVPGGGGRGR